MVTFFKIIKEIKSKTGELHFRRFAIFHIFNFCSLFVHFIYKEDKDKYLHNHPWNYVGLVLKGSYTEETELGTRQAKLGTVSFGNRKFFHKILKINDGPVVTLFFVYGKYIDWGYKSENGFVESKDYRKSKNNT